MKFRVGLRTGIALLGTVAILLAGVVYATLQFVERGVPGSFVVGEIRTTDSAIVLYSQVEPVTAELTHLRLGVRDMDIFGVFVPPARFPFWAANGGGTPFNLSVEATEVAINGTPVVAALDGGGVLQILMGPQGGQLLPAPDHALLLEPGDDPVALELELRLLGPPVDLGLAQGDEVTFTALFRADVLGDPEPPPPEPITPPAGMVAWWPGDDHPNDIIGGNDGTLVGGATYTGGMVNEAFSLDGNGDYVSAPFSQEGPFTVDAWVKANSIDQASYTSIFASGNPGEYDPYFQIDFDAFGNYRFHGGSDAFHVQIGAATTSYQHIAVTYDGTTVRTYLDGTLQNSGAWPGAPLRFTTAKLGANRDLNKTFDGDMDEVEIFNRALTEAEIRAIYEAGSAGKIKPEPPEPIEPPAGMVSWWPGDDHPNDAVDSNDGTLQGGATYAPGMVGPAFSFDASLNTGVIVPATPSLNMTEAISIDAWVYPTSFPNTGNTVVRKDRFVTETGALVQYSLSVTDQGQASCNINSNPAASVSGGTVLLDNWTHVACTYDRSQVRLYVNGEEVASTPFTEAIISSSQPLGIGTQPGFSGRDFDGLIDEVEIFDRALTEAEIRAIYEANSAGKIKPDPPTPGEPLDQPAGMVGWWPGDDNPEDIVGDNDGNLVGGAGFVTGMVDQAFKFDGVDGYMDLGSQADLSIDSISDDMTIDFWFRIDSQRYNVLAAKGIGLAGNEWWVRQRGDVGGFLEFQITDTEGDSTYVLTSTAIAEAVFHHLALVRSGTTGRLYLDGVQIAADSEPALGDIGNPHDLLIGASNRLEAIDEIEIFDRAVPSWRDTYRCCKWPDAFHGDLVSRRWGPGYGCMQAAHLRQRSVKRRGNSNYLCGQSR